MVLFIKTQGNVEIFLTFFHPPLELQSPRVMPTTISTAHVVDRFDFCMFGMVETTYFFAHQKKTTRIINTA